MKFLRIFVAFFVLTALGPAVAQNLAPNSQPGYVDNNAAPGCAAPGPCFHPYGASIPVAPATTGITGPGAAFVPTAPTFTSALAANSSRKACTIQNNGSTTGYVYFGANADATLTNTFQVQPSGGIAYCTIGNVLYKTNVSATCASGTCAFVVSEGQ